MILRLFPLSLLTTLVAVPAPRDIEHYCNGSTEIVESWVIPPGPWAGIELYVCNGIAPGIFICPGFPSSNCASSGAQPGDPALQSIENAVASWNSAGVLPVVPTASTLKFQSDLGFASIPNWTQVDVTLITPADNRNMITLWEPASTFANLGGPNALALTSVYFPTATGQIFQADIALNRRSTGVDGRPLWSFVEENVLFDKTFVSVAANPNESPFAYKEPLLGYADLQGVLTHELGHMAGLGHSLIDASADANGSRFPCMFPYAQAQPFEATVHFANLQGCNTDAHVANGATTAFGGISGKNARKLRLDDVAAIGAAYPTPAFTSNLGTIQGVVRWGNNQPVEGASVVAVNKRSPDSGRVGTLSYGGGFYSLSGLPAGEWYVCVEPVDQDNASGSTSTDYYFGQAIVPNYVYLLDASGCVSSSPVFDTEFQDGNEAELETSASNATMISVAAGGVSQRDFTVGANGDFFGVALAGAARYSPRGLWVLKNGATYPAVSLRVQFPTTVPVPVSIHFTNTRKIREVGNQVAQFPASGPGLPPTVPGVPATVQGMTNSSGVFVHTLQLTNASAFMSLFAQASIGSGASAVFSNAATIWVTE